MNKHTHLCFGLFLTFAMILTSCQNGAINSQVDDSNPFFDKETNATLTMLPLESLERKLQTYMGLDPMTSQAFSELQTQADVFGGVSSDGISRNLNYTYTRHTQWIKTVANVACAEALSTPQSKALIFPNNDLDVSAFFEAMTDVTYSSEVNLVFEAIKNLDGFSALELDQQQMAICIGAAGNIFVQKLF